MSCQSTLRPYFSWHRYLDRRTSVDPRAFVDGDVVGGGVQLVDVELVAAKHFVARLAPLLRVVQLKIGSKPSLV